MFAIYKRELSSYFSSPVGYIVLAAFMAFSGIYFYIQCLFSGTSSMYGVFQSMFFILLFIIPLITMRSFADDRRHRTDQALLTSPVKIHSIVTAKFLSALTMLALCLVSYIIEGIILSMIASPDWSVLFGNILGMLFMGSSFIAIGVFISSLTENAIVAALVSFMANVIISLIDTISSTVSWDFLKNVLSSLSFQNKYGNFSLGLISLSDVVFFVSSAALFLFLTDRVLDRRRWA